MAFSAKEKKFLRSLVEKELKNYKREKKTLLFLPVRFLKGGHDFRHFLEGIIKKLK